MKIFLYIVIGLIVIWFVGGMITAVIVGSKKKRGKVALRIFLSFSQSAKSMLFDIFRLHQVKKINEVNNIVEKSTNTTNEILSVLSPENRPEDFSSGKKFDRVTWTMYQKNFMKNGYSELAASLMSGVFLFELEELLSEESYERASKCD